MITVIWFLQSVVDSAVLLASAGDTSGWSMLKNGIESMASDFYLSFVEAGIYDKHITVNFMNDRDPSKAILSFLDGVCVYDAMEAQQ